MEQRLDTSFLQPSPIERAAALAIGAVGIGIGALLALWGASLWHRSLSDVSASKPEKPFESPMSIKPPLDGVSIPAGATGTAGNTKTGSGNVLTREVTVFWKVAHEQGSVVTGWNYPDGRGGVPVSEYCYYSTGNTDGSSTRINLGLDGNRAFSSAVFALVPDLEGAVAKCQWSR